MGPVELVANNGVTPQKELVDSAVSVRGLSVAYQEAPVVFAASCDFHKGRMAAIIGPNGAGKSTLLKASLGILKPLAGQVRFFGRPLAAVRHRLAYVPQRSTIDWDFPARVEDVVMMGLYGRLGRFSFIGKRERLEVEQALERVNMAPFAKRQIGALSGGQQQRVFLARALVQRADVYLLDEPFSGVDAATEEAIFKVLRDLADHGKTIICVHHSLKTVQEKFDDLVILNRSVVASGPVKAVFTAQNLSSAYGPSLSAYQLAELGLSQPPHKG